MSGGNETSTPTSAEIQQDCLAQYNLFNQALTAFNNSLARAGISTLVTSPTQATTLASIQALPV